MKISKEELEEIMAKVSDEEFKNRVLPPEETEMAKELLMRPFCDYRARALEIQLVNMWKELKKMEVRLDILESICVSSNPRR